MDDAKRTLGEPSQRRRSVAILRRQLLAVAVQVAVALRHDVHVDAAGHGEPPQPILKPPALAGVAGCQHRRVFLPKRRLRQQLVVAGDFAAGLEWRRLQPLDLPVDQQVQQVQVGRDPPGTGIVFTVADLLVGFAVLLAVMPPHLLDQNVIDQREHRRNAVFRYPQRSIDHEAGAHHGDVEGVWARPGGICHESSDLLQPRD